MKIDAPRSQTLGLLFQILDLKTVFFSEINPALDFHLLADFLKY